jgi:hypothetical protein
MSEQTTPADVIAFIVARADDTDLSNIIGAVNARRKTLRTIAAASVKPGLAVRLDGLSPKYLNGLTGTVKSVEGQHCTVTLDAASTERLGWQSRFSLQVRMSQKPDGTYDFGGVPSSCAKAV